MARCDNCFNEAAYTCADPGMNPVNYCTACLPVWLQERANAGHFPLMEPIEESSEEASTKKKKKAASSNEDSN